MKGSVKIGMVVMTVAALVLMALGALAAEAQKKAPSPKQQAHQERMKTCNAEAKAQALKGDERKAFMSECLKSKPDEGAPSSDSSGANRKEKTKACKAEAKAKGLKGEQQKTFMNECLKSAS